MTSLIGGEAFAQGARSLKLASRPVRECGPAAVRGSNDLKNPRIPNGVLMRLQQYG